MSDRSTLIRDGFEDLFQFFGHNLQLKGYRMIDADPSKLSPHYNGVKVLTFYSWDSKSVILWQYTRPYKSYLASNNDPVILKQIKFPQSNYIPSIVYVSNSKLFLAVALDMTFRLYDKNLNLIEVIRHDERTILNVEYDTNRDVIVANGASGISCWKLYRNKSVSLSYTIEKIHVYDEYVSKWVSKMIYDQENNKIFVLNDTSLDVIGINEKKTIAKLSKLHDYPLAYACWYCRSQFYITACSQGLIRLWSSNFTANERNNNNSSNTITTAINNNLLQNSINNSSSHQCNGSRRKSSIHAIAATFNNLNEMKTNTKHSEKTFALGHTFYAHAKAVTALILHEVSGLLISSSLDYHIKVLNLETLTELYSINTGAAITQMKPFLALNLGNHMSIAYSHDNGSITCMDSTPCASFFSALSSKVTQILQFSSISSSGTAIINGSSSNTAAGTVTVNNTDSDVDEVIYNDAYDVYIAALCEQGFNVYNTDGMLVSQLKPEDVTRVVTSCTISIKHQLLLCLYDGGVISIYSLRHRNSLEVISYEINKTYGVQATSVVLVNTTQFHDLSEKATNAVRRTAAHTATYDDKEAIVIGSSSGILLFFSIASDCQLHHVYSHETSMNIQSMQYNHMRKELFLFGRTVTDRSGTLAIYQLPGVACRLMMDDLVGVTCLGISIRTQLFALGCNDGFVRLFTLFDLKLHDSVTADANGGSGNHGTTAAIGTGTTIVDTDKYQSKAVEILQPSQLHSGPVSSISFYDELSIYLSVGIDNCIHICDHTKHLHRSIQYNSKLSSVLCLPHTSKVLSPGDILLSQSTYLLSCPLSTWNKDDVLAYVNVVDAVDKESLSSAYFDKNQLGELNSSDDVHGFLSHLLLNDIKTINSISTAAAATTAAAAIVGVNTDDDAEETSVFSSDVDNTTVKQHEADSDGFMDRLQANDGKYLNIRHPRIYVNANPSAVSIASSHYSSKHTDIDGDGDGDMTRPATVTNSLINFRVLNGSNAHTSSSSSSSSGSISLPLPPYEVQPSKRSYRVSNTPMGLTSSSSSSSSSSSNKLYTVDDEYRAKRGITYGIAAGFVSLTPSIQLNKKTGEMTVIQLEKAMLQQQLQQRQRGGKKDMSSRMSLTSALTTLNRMRFGQSYNKSDSDATSATASGGVANAEYRKNSYAELALQAQQPSLLPVKGSSRSPSRGYSRSPSRRSSSVDESVDGSSQLYSDSPRSRRGSMIGDIFKPAVIIGQSSSLVRRKEGTMMSKRSNESKVKHISYKN